MSDSGEHGCTTAVGIGFSPLQRSTSSSSRCSGSSFRTFADGALTSTLASAIRVPEASVQRQSSTITARSRWISFTATVAVTV